MRLSLAPRIAPAAASLFAVATVAAAGLNAGDAQALSCTFGAIASGNCAAATIGNLTFSNFTVSGNYEATDVLDINLTPTNGFYNIVASFTNGNPLSGTGNYGFSVAAASGFALDQVAVDSDVSILGTGTFQFANAFTNSPDSPLVSAGGSAAGAFTPGATASNVLISWTDNGGTNVGNSSSLQLTTNPPSIIPVPGPLPLFGAAAAFGYSRRLRRRVKTASC
jgi:hypothetical protein